MPHFSNHFHAVPLNVTDIPQNALNIERKIRSNPLKWNGQFSPQLVAILLDTYATSGSSVFDPFLGSGTVLLEAGIRQIAASGTEINPAAYSLANTYRLINLSLSARQAYLGAVRQKLDAIVPFSWPTTIQYRVEPCDEIKRKLVNAVLCSVDSIERILLTTLVILTDLSSSECSAQKLFATWSKIEKHILHLPYSEAPIKIRLADARTTPLSAASIDFVLTSPPYINVFNYHQQYRKSAEALHWKVLAAAKSEIGSNRKHRGNRFLTVIQYCLDMALVFAELRRVCRPDALVLLVVGRESNVRGTPFYNGQIVSEIANRAAGFDLARRQERWFRNQFGQTIYEDILHFKLGKSPINYSDCLLPNTRRVAESALQAAFDSTPKTAHADIEAALLDVNKVLPSPLFDPEKILLPESYSQ